MKKYAGLVAFLAVVFSSPASAEMVLSKVILDLNGEDHRQDDIEIFNSGAERIYVVADPYEIIAPGTEQQLRKPAIDPEVSGILVSPRKLIIEPGERRIVRVAILDEQRVRERIFRLAVKPVVGDVTANTNALKVLIGYDALVISRPTSLVGNIESDREGRTLTIINNSNMAREFFGAVQCDQDGVNCVKLPARRLYAGTSWSLELPYNQPVTFDTAWASQNERLTF
ncbi:hypothetical protein P7228_09130 [Altererythrobacter arenosus]|uniref:Fimbria/pilus periplasmic chaperone n=1 Tax=Altererythrobacter arenosus TaxID=3032592 RepID=A0ABY8FMD4_9SPHN|nr:hypothetical protein [Altererythrobacter sp. CAU 1644]WFL76163.1 hypothetical protein P7228_09130 [Altererythrobacter sp. CAU 1644]